MSWTGVGDTVDSVKNSIVDIQFTLRQNESNGGDVIKSRISVSSPSIPLDINFVSPETAINRSSFLYGGLHDHGDLPQMRSEGRLADILAAIVESKQKCDKYLTEKLNESSNIAGVADLTFDKELGGNSLLTVPSEKKPRIEDDK